VEPLFEQLYCLSRKELSALVKGHEIDQKDLVEAMRVQAIIGLQPHLKKGANLDPIKIWPLPWDKTAKHLETTPQDFVKARKLLEIARKLERNGKSKNRG